MRNVMSKLHQFIMNLWPSKKQWKDWTLPSKLTAIGALIGVAAIVLTVLLFAINVLLTPNVEKIVRKVADEYKTELNARYPIAHTVFGVHQTGIVVPKGLMPENLEIEWSTGSVQHVANNMLLVTFPNMVLNGKSFIDHNKTAVEKRIGARSGSVIRLGWFNPIVEVIGIQDDLVVVALGFPGSDKK